MKNEEGEERKMASASMILREGVSRVRRESPNPSFLPPSSPSYLQRRFKLTRLARTEKPVSQTL